MFPKKGNVFPARKGGRTGGNRRYAAIVADALRASLGDTHRAAKTLMRWTGANERTVKHWLAGEFGPSGNHLIVLLRESDAVLQAVLGAAGRRNVLDAMRILEVRAAIAGVLGSTAGGHDETPPRTADDRTGGGAGGRLGDQDDPVNDRINDPINDRVKTPGDEPGRSLGAVSLNGRQRWFLYELARGSRVGPSDLRRQFGVAETTARRDIGGLRSRGLVRFIGPRRTGRYRLSR